MESCHSNTGISLEKYKQTKQNKGNSRFAVAVVGVRKGKNVLHSRTRIVLYCVSNKWWAEILWEIP